MKEIIPINWHTKVLKEHKKEITYSAAFSFVVALGYLIWSHFQGFVFVWQSISPIEQPSILARYFYSAFTFVTIGAFLYYVVKLWKGLHFIFVKVLGSWEIYNLVKYFVWLGLMAITYFYIVPTVVGIMNAALSFFYNIFNFILYISPGIGIFLILTVVCAYCIALAKKRLVLPHN
jgi:hypothetical protein